MTCRHPSTLNSRYTRLSILKANQHSTSVFNELYESSSQPFTCSLKPTSLGLIEIQTTCMFGHAMLMLATSMCDNCIEVEEGDSKFWELLSHPQPCSQPVCLLTTRDNAHIA